MGQNSGFANENEFTTSLNLHKYNDVCGNAQVLMRQLYPTMGGDDLIYAKRIGGKCLKPDVEVEVDANKTNISLKEGGGNSVHQERIGFFLEYCKENLGMTEEERDSFLAFQYGDGTLDGTGDDEDKVESSKIKEVFSEDIKTIQNFIDRNRRPLIERFLIYGRTGHEKNVRADYLYHGRITDGVWCPLDETVDYIIDVAEKSQDKSSISIGPLTYQVYSRGTEKGKHDIQIKWANRIVESIKEINQIYLEKVKKNKAILTPKIFGDNSHGFKNAREIVKGLNGCRVRNLKGSLWEMVNTIFPHASVNDIVFCKNAKAHRTNVKSDISVTIGGVTKNVAIFMGDGTSGHQENFEEFVTYCKESLHMTSLEENALRIVFYGDGTSDGTGKIEDRLNASGIKKKYPLEVQLAQAFFDIHKRELSKRWLIDGVIDNNVSPDYVFYGNVEQGITISYDYIIDYIERYFQQSPALLTVGPLKFQMWGRNLGNRPDMENRRCDLQIKFSNLSVHIPAAYKMHEELALKSKIDGINAEYELVAALNKNKHIANPLWDFLLDGDNSSLDKIYAVRVVNKVYSDFLGGKVFPKSDLYLCHAEIPDEILKDCGYALDEEILEDNGVEYTPIEHTGISCKIPTSKHFTYSKLSVSTFAKIFGNSILGAGASLFVKADDTKFNIDVINGWGVSESDFVSFVNSVDEFSSITFSSISELTPENFKKIKTYCISKIKQTISENDSIKGMIFMGRGLFEEPYNANYIFSYGKLSENTAPADFEITTGSGRHEKKYTIIVKPKAKQTSTIIPLQINGTIEMAAESRNDNK